MIDQPNNDVKLVEYNTIASSFGVLTQKVGIMQEYIREKYKNDIPQKYSFIYDKEGLSDEDKQILHFGNDAMKDFISKMVNYFKRAIDSYKQSMKEKYGSEPSDPWVLFVITAAERNILAQKIIEYEL